MPRRITAIVAALLALVLLSGAASAQSLLMATTTSTDNTGLLDYLAPKFQRDTGIELKWTAVGTGKALELGRNCDADVLLVHAPPAEKRYVDNGYGMNRTRVMYNDFVIIGPPGDPAGVEGVSVTGALQEIRADGATFVSRGDDSGTHKKELGLWKEAGLQAPAKRGWYLETGQGMMATIRVAAERDGYTLADRGTYIKYAENFGGEPPLTVLVEGDKALFNQYSVMAVNPENCPNVQHERAQKFIHWITSPETQQEIASYQLLGKKLFTPNARCAQ
jgi:tungstate transport system substrate-binding protein